MGTHLRVLSESYPMNTKTTGFRWISKNLCILVFLTKVYILSIGNVNLQVISELNGLSLHVLCGR